MPAEMPISLLPSFSYSSFSRFKIRKVLPFLIRSKIRGSSHVTKSIRPCLRNVERTVEIMLVIHISRLAGKPLDDTYSVLANVCLDWVPAT